MAMSFDTFPVSWPQKPLQIIPYNGPPKPKQSSQRSPSKKVEDKYHDIDKILGIGPRSNTQRKDKGDLALTSYEAEVIDMTCLDGEVSREIGVVGGVGGRDGGSNDDSSNQNECKRVWFEQSVSIQTSPEDINQPAPSKGTSQETAVVIDDSQPESDTDEGCLQEDNTGISTPEYRRRECSTGTEDAINSEVVNGAEIQASGLLRRESTSTPKTSLPEASDHTILKATTHKPQRLMQKAERQGIFPTFENVSSSSEIDDNNGDDDSGNDITWLTSKRKRSPPAKRRNRASNTTSKQRPKHAAHSARQRKLCSLCDRPISNHPLTPKPLSAAHYSGYDTTICYSDDGSSESSDRGGHSKRTKRLMSTARTYHSRGHRQKRNRGSTDEDDEYEVEEILDACVNRRKLQYRVKWLGYEDDPQWHDASNFKNSPHKLRSFHTASPTRPGPPKMLERWLQCWEEDIDAGDHPDDNKPKQSYPRGGKLMDFEKRLAQKRRRDEDSVAAELNAETAVAVVSNQVEDEASQGQKKLKLQECLLRTTLRREV